MRNSCLVIHTRRDNPTGPKINRMLCVLLLIWTCEESKDRLEGASSWNCMSHGVFMFNALANPSESHIHVWTPARRSYWELGSFAFTRRKYHRKNEALNQYYICVCSRIRCKIRRNHPFYAHGSPHSQMNAFERLTSTSEHSLVDSTFGRESDAMRASGRSVVYFVNRL